MTEEINRSRTKSKTSVWSLALSYSVAFLVTLIRTCRGGLTAVILFLGCLLLLSVVAYSLFRSALNEKSMPLGNEYENVDEVKYYHPVDLSCFCGKELGSRSCSERNESRCSPISKHKLGFITFDSLLSSVASTAALLSVDQQDTTYILALLTKGYYAVHFFVLTSILTFCLMGWILVVAIQAINSNLKTIMDKIQARRYDAEVNGVCAPPKREDLKTGEAEEGEPEIEAPTRPKTKTPDVIIGFVEIAVVMTLIINACFSCVGRGTYDGKEIFNTMFTVSDWMFFCALVLESGTKMIWGIRKYFHGWNIFEFLLLWLTCPLVLQALPYEKCVTFLKALQVLKLGRHCPTFNLSWTTLRRPLTVQRSFLFLYLALVWVMAIVGTKLLTSDSEETEKHGFSKVFQCVISILRILFGDWGGFLYHSYHSSGWITLPFFLVLLVLGKYVLVNVLFSFVTVYLHSYWVTKHESYEASIPRMSAAVNVLLSCHRIFQKKPSASESQTQNEDNERKDSLDQIHPDDPTGRPTRFAMDLEDRDEQEDRARSPSECLGSVWPLSRLKPTPACLHRICLKVANSCVLDLAVIIFVVHGCLFHVLTRFQWEWPFFVFEMILKVYALGPSKFFSSGWRTVDFLLVFVVIFGVLLVPSYDDIRAFVRSFLILRLFRILKYFLRFKAFRVMANCFLECVPGLINVILDSSFRVLIFALLLMGVSPSMTWRCTDGNSTLVHGLSSQHECLRGNYTLYTMYSGLENVPDLVGTLLRLATFEEWTSGTENGQMDDAQLFLYHLLLLAFLLEIALFGFHLTFSLMLHAYSKHKQDPALQEHPGDAVQRRIQKFIQRKSLDNPFKRMTSPYRTILHRILVHPGFDLLTAINIMAGFVVSSLSERTAYFAVVGVLGAELLFRLLACSNPLLFIKNLLNVLDVFILATSATDVAMHRLISSHLLPPLILRVVRLCQMTWRQRFMRYLVEGRRLLLTMARSVPYLLSICLVWSLVLMVYVVIGTAGLTGPLQVPWSYFGVQDPGPTLGLLRCVTRSALGTYLISLSFLRTTWGPSFCDDRPIMTCMGPHYVALFLISLVFLSYVVFCAALAVLVFNYHDAFEDIRLGTSPYDCKEFYTLWRKYDAHHLGFMPVKDLPDLLDHLTGPLRVARPNECQVALLDLPIYSGNYVYYKEVLGKLFLVHLKKEGIICSEEFDDAPLQAEDTDVVSTTLWRAHETRCARVIEKAWLRYKKRDKEC